MNSKTLVLLFTGGLLVLAAWLVHAPNPAASIEHEPTMLQGLGTGDSDVPEKYRATVHKGLEFLAKSQFKDGHWEGAGGQHPVAVTALAGMAFLMEGSNVSKGKYSANLRKAVDWLIDQSQEKREGLIYSGHPSESARYMQGHGLATQFLGWAHRHERDADRLKKVNDVLGRAVKYIVKAQSTQGGWYDTSKVEGHDFASISATAIQIQTLYFASAFGIPGPTETVAADGQEYMKTAHAKYDKASKPDAKRNKPAETAAALACRANPSAYLDQDGQSAKWFKYCRAEIPTGDKIQFGRDEFTHYYYAQALFNVMLNPESNAGSQANWTDYRRNLFDHLQNTQGKDGSWPAPAESQGGISAGPVYSTAVWCMVLQFDKKSHPLTRQRLLNTF